MSAQGVREAARLHGAERDFELGHVVVPAQAVVLRGGRLAGLAAARGDPGGSLVRCTFSLVRWFVGSLVRSCRRCFSETSRDSRGIGPGRPTGL